MMNKIIINGRFLTGSMTGINRFAYELTKALSKMCHCEIIVPRNSIRYDQYDITDLNIVEYGSFKSHIWEQISLYRYLRNQENCLLLGLSGIGPILYSNKITTIHDLSFLHNPKWFSKTYYYFYKRLTPLAINTSRMIFTVSNFSKSEILKYYKINDDNIKVVYNAISSHCNTKNVVKSNKTPYVLTVGSLDPRKNLKILFDVFGDERLKNYELHVIGSSNRVFGDLNIDAESLTNVKMLGHVSDSILYQEYEDASVFISASLYEGFGIPPLEALSHNIPILVSDIPVYREIYEDAARYFNPFDKENIIKMILQQLSDNKFDEQKAAKIIGKYSWSKSAEIIMRTINRM